MGPGAYRKGSQRFAGYSWGVEPRHARSLTVAATPCATDLIVNGLIHQKQLVGDPRPYALPSPTVPPPELAFQFDLPQSYATGPAFVLIYPTVSDRVRAQSAFPPTDTVGGRGRLIWSLDSVAASDAAPYRLGLAALAGADQPCGQPAG